MKKAQIALASICLLAALGSAVAFKARFADGFIRLPNGSYVHVTNDADCPVTGTGCLYTVNTSTYQIYTFSNNTYQPLAQE